MFMAMSGVMTRFARVARESWRRVALSAVEALQIRRWLADPTFHERIDWVGPWEEIERRHRAGEPFLLVSGHLGPFEVVLPTLVHRGWRIDLLSRHIKNGYVHKMMHWLRSGTVPGILDPSGALPEMGRSLRAGRCLAMLVDQKHPGWSACPLPWSGGRNSSCGGGPSASIPGSRGVPPCPQTRGRGPLSHAL